MEKVQIKAVGCRKHRWSLVVPLVLMLSVPALAGGPVSTEYRLKAALIYKLTRFVEWPKTGDTHGAEQFGICVLGRDDFGSALDALQGRVVNDAVISIRRFNQSDGVGMNCQMIFISDSKRAFIGTILHSFGNYPILTIGDSSRFAEKGGMIQFTRDGKHIGFKINLRRAHASGLKIAAPLLQLATIVDGIQESSFR